MCVARISRFVYPLGGIYAMADRSNKQSDMPATAAALTAGLRLTPQMKIMFRVFLSSPQRTKLLLLGVALVTVIGTTAFGQVMLNAWNQPFYNALTRKDSTEFFDQLAVFGMIAAGKLKLRIEHTYPLAEAQRAHRDLEGRKTTGKLLLIP